MGIQVTWHNPDKYILLWEFSGRWTWKQFDQARAEVRAAVLDVGHPIGMIVEFLPGSLTPPDLISRVRYLSQSIPAPPIVVFKVFIVPDTLLMSLLKALQVFLPAHWRGGFADTREEAAALLEAQLAKQTVPNSQC